MEESITFSEFLGRAWWLMLIGFGHAFDNAKEVAIFESTFANILFSVGFILFVLYVYWVAKYSKSQ